MIYIIRVYVAHILLCVPSMSVIQVSEAHIQVCSPNTNVCPIKVCVTHIHVYMAHIQLCVSYVSVRCPFTFVCPVQAHGSL